MPIHIEAKPEDIAKIVLLPGNPQRAEYIAKKFFKNPKLYNKYRLMYGFTGTYKGYEISVQTTGMGTPSFLIVAEELNMLGAKTLIRVGTAGGLQPILNISDIVIATSAHSSHAIFSQKFNGANFSAVADLKLSYKLYEKAIEKKFPAHFGSILTSETFYEDDISLIEKFTDYNTIAVEMEAYALFGIAAKYNLKSACIVTISDLLFNYDGEKRIFNPHRGDKAQIAKGVDYMIELVLDTIIENYEYLIN